MATVYEFVFLINEFLNDRIKICRLFRYVFYHLSTGPSEQLNGKGGKNFFMSIDERKAGFIAFDNVVFLK